MNKTAIVMDSTGYLTPDILKQCQIKVIPLSVNIGNETFAETELTNAIFFAKLNSISGMATTSQPSVGSFLELYEKLFKSGYEEIVSIHLTPSMSGTLLSAQMAKDLATKQTIHIFDSGSTALGLGLLARAAGEWAIEGLNANEIMQRLVQLKSQTELYFIVDNLDSLRRGGRIGRASALLGSLLQVKPILIVNKEGIVDIFDKVRSRNKALQRVLDELDRAISTGQTYRIAVIHVNCHELGQKIIEEIQTRHPDNDIRLFEIGPVVASHVGQGTFGVAFHPMTVELFPEKF